MAAGTILARSQGFWSPDSALRFIQVQRLLTSGYRDFSIPYPAAALDPDGRYFPLGDWFHFRRNGRFYLAYSPYFSMLSAPLFRLFGFSGLLLIPALAALGTVWASYEAVRARAPELAGPAAAVVGLATPLFMYGVVFWDHSLAVALAAGALLLLARAVSGPAERGWDVVGAGALLGLGLWFRNEMYAFAAAVILAWIFTSGRSGLRNLGLLLSGAAGPAGGLWVLNTMLFGSAVGWKGHDLVATRITGVAHASTGTPGAVAWIIDKLSNAYYQLVSPDFYAFNPTAIMGGVMLSGALLLGALLLIFGVRRHSGFQIFLGAGVATAVTILLAADRTMVSGLLPTAPVVVLALGAGFRGRWERFLWSVIVLFGAAIIATGTHGGLQWGPRYLLPAIPALVWLAASTVCRMRTCAAERWPLVRHGLAAFVAAALMLQAAGLDQVLQASVRNARLNAWLGRAPAHIVVTPLQWLTIGSGPVYFQKQLLLVQNAQEFRQLADTLSVQHVTRWTYIPFSGLAFAPMAVAKWSDDKAWRFHPIQDSVYEGLRMVTYMGFAAPLSGRR
jgi:hypothetical protein